MSSLSGFLTTAAGLLLLAAYFNGASGAEVDLSNKAGSKVCVGKICDDSTVFYYFECCGTIYDECCFKLQTWVLVVLIVAGVLVLLGAIGGFVKCICCCDNR
ncbi:hypothetical protein FO519_003592 [Halicephalobus sp. NKZ332]|nr:hypothetical protein FO519_003592 [Halicephalobus sp. NKZ332]